MPRAREEAAKAAGLRPEVLTARTCWFKNNSYVTPTLVTSDWASWAAPARRARAARAPWPRPDRRPFLEVLHHITASSTSSPCDTSDPRSGRRGRPPPPAPGRGAEYPSPSILRDSFGRATVRVYLRPQMLRFSRSGFREDGRAVNRCSRICVNSSSSVCRLVEIASAANLPTSCRSPKLRPPRGCRVEAEMAGQRTRRPRRLGMLVGVAVFRVDQRRGGPS